MVTDLWCHLIYNLRGAWHTVSGKVLFSQTQIFTSLSHVLAPTEAKPQNNTRILLTSASHRSEHCHRTASGGMQYPDVLKY